MFVRNYVIVLMPLASSFAAMAYFVVNPINRSFFPDVIVRSSHTQLSWGDLMRV